MGSALGYRYSTIPDADRRGLRDRGPHDRGAAWSRLPASITPLDDLEVRRALAVVSAKVEAALATDIDRGDEPKFT